MNLKKLLRILGKMMILEGGLMLLPLTVAFIYKEACTNILAFLL